MADDLARARERRAGRRQVQQALRPPPRGPVGATAVRADIAVARVQDAERKAAARRGELGPTRSRLTMVLDDLERRHEVHGPAVDALLGVEEPTVDLWEAGLLVPTWQQVQHMSMLSGRPWQFFYMPPLEELTGLRMCSIDPDGSTAFAADDATEQGGLW